jgi:hypothetical protein
MKHALTVSSLILLGALGCSHESEQRSAQAPESPASSASAAPGPAQRAGKDIDDGAAGVKGRLREAGDSIDRATDDAARKYKDATTSESGPNDRRIP